MKFLSCCAARLFCEKIASMCHHACWGKEEVKSKCASKRACRNNKVIVGNEALAASLECTRMDVYRNLTPYLAGFCTTHRDLFLHAPRSCLRSVLFGNDLYGLPNVWLPATGKYSCYGKVLCGFMNARAPNSQALPTYAVLTAGQTWLF